MGRGSAGLKRASSMRSFAMRMARRAYLLALGKRTTTDPLFGLSECWTSVSSSRGALRLTVEHCKWPGLSALLRIPPNTRGVSRGWCWSLGSSAGQSQHGPYRCQRAPDYHTPSDLAEIGSRHSDLTTSKFGPNGHDRNEAGAIRPDSDISDPPNPFSCFGVGRTGGQKAPQDLGFGLEA